MVSLPHEVQGVAAAAGCLDVMEWQELWVQNLRRWMCCFCYGCCWVMLPILLLAPS